MTYDDLIAYYGTQKGIADALGITQPTVSAWGRVVPARYQYQIEVLTDGALLVEDALRVPRKGCAEQVRCQ
jgi:DNA-binding transcriptional regulator YdaS (Cro superfamily)